MIACSGFGCIDEADKKCNAVGGNCHPTLGICICYSGYSGAQCQTKATQMPDIVDGQLTDGRLAGIIIGWIIGVPVCVAAVTFLVFEWKESNNLKNRYISCYTSTAKKTNQK